MLPVYSVLIGNGSDAGKLIEVSQTVLNEILQQLLVRVEVNEDWYIKRYPDVGEAISPGLFKSAKEHFTRSGYFEDRLPSFIAVKEAWYMEKYPDVATAIKDGVLANAQQHFELYGYKEGRIPFEGWSLLDERNP